jgi:hypothetical protein
VAETDLAFRRAVGVVIGQFDRPEIAQSAVVAIRRAVERVAIISALSPDIKTLLVSFGVDPQSVNRLLGTIRPDKLLLVARIERGTRVGGVLGVLWRCQAQNLIYVPVASGRRTSRSS